MRSIPAASVSSYQRLLKLVLDKEAAPIIITTTVVTALRSWFMSELLYLASEPMALAM